jgi:hypothetical protein
VARIYATGHDGQWNGSVLLSGYSRDGEQPLSVVVADEIWEEEK